jgi:NAD/NADP transhydrogenase beta subunit
VIQPLEMEDINPRMGNAHVAILIGADDAVGPMAHEPGSPPLCGIPVINVDKAAPPRVDQSTAGKNPTGET